MKEQWYIWVGGYGGWVFDGDEAAAEEMREHKARWEAGVGVKYRITNPTELDKLRKEQVDLWETGNGVPMKLMKKIGEAKKKENRK